MIRQNILPALLLSLIFFSCNNAPKSDAPAAKDSPGYNFAVPPKWTTEEFPFPVSFAPQINYKGVEVLRFAPGWATTNNDEHWSYTFLWWLEGKPAFDVAVLQQNLTDYYTGLLNKNVRERNIPSNKVNLPTVFIQKIDTAPGDLETWNGTIKMTDYLDILYRPMALNCTIHKKDCGERTAMIFEISLQQEAHAVRKQLADIAGSFSCK